MDTARFEEMVAEVLAAVPEPFARHLDSVEVVVEPVPTRAQRRSLRLRPRETLYGLYEGVPVPQRLASAGGEGSLILPSRITLFRRALSAHFPDEDTLRAEVRKTLLHELAHHFGIDDRRLVELGAY